MSVQQFDPLKHKRGAGGKFTDMLRELRPGSAVHLPDGIHVKASNERYGAGRRRMYTIHGPNGEKLGNNHLEAQTAAALALNKSAQHEHPDAVGGKKRHETYAAAMDYAQNGTKEEPIRKAEEAAGGAHARVASNAAELRRAYPANPREALRKAKAERDRGVLPRFQANALIAHINAELAIQKREGRQPVANAEGFRIEGKDLQVGQPRLGDKPQKRFIVYEPGKPGGTVFKTRDEAEAHMAKRKAAVGAVAKAKADVAGKLDVAGNPDKPKASDLTPGVTKLTHTQHGEMIYMGRNATNHHVARKVGDGEGGKKHIIRLKEIKIGSASERGSQQSMGVDKGTATKVASLNEPGEMRIGKATVHRDHSGNYRVHPGFVDFPTKDPAEAAKHVDSINGDAKDGQGGYDGWKADEGKGQFAASAAKAKVKPAKVEGARKVKVKNPKYGEPDVTLQVKPMENPIYKGDGHAAFEVFDEQGNKVGEVRTSAGYKDGPKVMGNVVAWRKNVINWHVERDGHPQSSSGEPNRAAALRQLVRRQGELADQKARYEAMDDAELKKTYDFQLKTGNQWYKVTGKMLKDREGGKGKSADKSADKPIPKGDEAILAEMRELSKSMQGQRGKPGYEEKSARLEKLRGALSQNQPKPAPTKEFTVHLIGHGGGSDAKTVKVKAHDQKDAENRVLNEYGEDYKVAKLTSGSAKAKTAPVYIAPLKQGASGPLGREVKVTGNAGIDDAKQKQLESDVANAKQKLQAARKNGTPKAIRDNAANVNSWEGKLRAFKEKRGGQTPRG